MIKKVLGLDISSSIVGIAVVSPSGTDDPTIDFIDHIDLTKIKTSLWDKVDAVAEYFDDKSHTPEDETPMGSRELSPGGPLYGLTDIYVEEHTKRFATGFSSAQVLMLLAKINGLVSYEARRTFGLDPEFIAPATARKTCGIKIVPTKKAGGKNAKAQTFEWGANGPLKNYPWPLKRTGKVKEWAKDATDAYVIARAGLKLELEKTDRKK